MTFTFTVTTNEEPTGDQMRDVISAFQDGMKEFVKLAPSGLRIDWEEPKAPSDDPESKQ